MEKPPPPLYNEALSYKKFMCRLFVLLLALSLGACIHTPPDSTSNTPPPTFTLAPKPALSQLPPVADINLDQEYSLEALIHLAQTRNATTRIAWLEAEQAAMASGMVQSTYLPIITASALGGYQRSKRHTRYDLDQLITVDSSNHTTARGVVPALTLNWLLFDFGRREAAHGAAQDLAFASKAKFTAAHQAIIFNVSRTFYTYNAAKKNTALAQQHVKNSQELLKAAQARYHEGIGTSIEVAQAKQLVAQARFLWVQNQGAERDAYQSVLGAVGLSPTTKIHIASDHERQFPRFDDLPDDERLQEALAYRPDLIAVEAAARAATKGIDAAEAAFRPVVGLIGVAATGSANFNLDGVVSANPNARGTALLLGISLPLYDGGLRRMRVQEARSRAEAAKELQRKTQSDALQEMHIAANALRSALEAYEASVALVEAAQITHDAAVESYKVGLSSMILATESANGLLDATQAQAVAYSATLIAAANLAFMMGQQPSP